MTSLLADGAAWPAKTRRRYADAVGEEDVENEEDEVDEEDEGWKSQGENGEEEAYE